MAKGKMFSTLTILSGCICIQQTGKGVSLKVLNYIIGESMSKITIEITEDDALDFLLKNYDETEKQKNKKNYSRFLLSLFFLAFAFYFLFTGSQIRAVIFCSLAVGWFFLLPCYIRSAVKQTYKDHVKTKMGMILNRPITYELKEKGVFVKYELEEATYYYESIHGISRSGRNVYINHKGKVPLIIPYGRDTESVDNFIKALEDKLGKL
jgi:hypothetical protein